MTPSGGVFRINGYNSVRRINSKKPASGAVSWWLAGGIAPANCIAAYQPKGAASYAASKVNLANPGTYDATEGVAPDWDAVNGWDFTAGDSYLDTGVAPGLDYTFIVRISDRAGASYDCIIGQRTAANSNATQIGNYGSIDSIFWYFGSSDIYIKDVDTGAGEAVDAVFGMSKGRAYLDGVLESTFDVPGRFSTTLSLYVGACNNYDGTADNFSVVKIQALSIYNSILTDSQHLAVKDAMNAL